MGQFVHACQLVHVYVYKGQVNNYENGGGGSNMIKKLEGIVVWCKTNDALLCIYYVYVYRLGHLDCSNFRA